MSAKPRASGGRLPDVSSSVFSASGVLLVLAVALLLKWAYGFDRRRRPDVVAQVLARDVLEERPDPAFPRDPVLLRQRNDMISTPSPAPEGAVLTPEADEAEQPRRDGVTVPRRTRSAASSAPATGSGLRRGRVGVALGALACLALGLIGLVLAPFTALTWPLPAFLLILGLGCLAGLRWLALTERTRTTVRTRPVREVEDLPTGTASDAGASRPSARTAAEPFDLQSGEARSAAPAEATRETASGPTPSGAAASSDEDARAQREMLREQARRVAAGHGDFVPRDATWEPVAVPRPTYMDAPEAQRPAPAPLSQPAAPRSTTRSLAEAEAKGRGALDLDDVLTRRRA